MRRCTNCFRFHPGSPTFCAYCGRSFDVRICSRGHRNHRVAEYCAECGSADLSMPAPPASFLHRASGLALGVLAVFLAAMVVLTLVLSLLSSIACEAVAGPLTMLTLMLLFLYWTTTLLPGPVKKLGKATGKSLIKSVRRKKHE